MFLYKTDILWELKVNGYTTTRLRKEKLLGEKAITTIRKGEVVGIHTLDRICGLLNKQPGELILYVPDSEMAETTESESEPKKEKEGEEDKIYPIEWTR